jgi:di/tricarboxylate transporter
MILTRCCSVSAARRSVNWQVLVVIAASLGLGRALESSGVAAAAARGLVGLGGGSPWVALAAVYGVTMVCTELMGHHAAAVLVFPIALTTAGALHVSLMPFVMAIIMAASFAFAMPIGEPTNLIVYGPGGYRFSDYLRLGGPLDLLLWATTVAIAPLVWPF